MAPFSSLCASVVSFIVSLTFLLSCGEVTYLDDIEKHIKNRNCEKLRRLKRLRTQKVVAHWILMMGLGNLRKKCG